MAFAHGPAGRPSLVDPPFDSPRFSLSHTEAHAAVAVAVGRRLGLDLEEIDASADALGTAGRFFTPSELAMLGACSGQERPDRFTTLWTIKEAVLKARGAGLASGLTTVAVQLDASGTLLRLSAPDPPWSVAAWSPVAGLRAALAVQAGTMPPLRFLGAIPLGPAREAPELGARPSGRAPPHPEPEPPRQSLDHALTEQILRPELLEGVGRPFHDSSTSKDGDPESCLRTGPASRSSASTPSSSAPKRKYTSYSTLNEATEVAADARAPRRGARRRPRSRSRRQPRATSTWLMWRSCSSPRSPSATSRAGAAPSGSSAST